MRALVQYQGPINSISLHVFGDASGVGVAAAAFTVVSQPSCVTQGIVAAKARLAKQGLTIPRLELVACHMATNMATNVREALEGYPVDQVYCWLNWITWRYVPTKENPADLEVGEGLYHKTGTFGGMVRNGFHAQVLGQWT